jgi:uncharacterized membrane protein YbhN (UPF0104 family)
MKADMGQVLHILKNAGLLLFAAASGLYIFAQALSTMRWRLLLPGRYTFGNLFSLYMIGAFFSGFLPGVVGGDAVRAYYLNKDAKKIGLTLASVFMDRYIGFASLTAIGITALPFSLNAFGGSPYRWLMPLIFIVFVAVSVLFFGLRAGKRFRFMEEAHDYFSELRGRKSALAKAFAISVVIQSLNFCSVLILAYGMGEPVPLRLLAIFLPIIITITSLPVSISGLGVREVSFVLLLGIIGIKAETATSISLAWFVSIFAGSLPGLAFYFLRGSGKEKVRD